MAAAKEQCVSGLISSIKSIHANLFREMHERCKDGLEPLASQTKEELENANIYLSKKHLRLYRGAVIADAYPSSFVHWCMENTPTQTILQTQLPDSKETLNVNTSVWQKLVPDLNDHISMSDHDDMNAKNLQLLHTCKYIQGLIPHETEKTEKEDYTTPANSQKNTSSKKIITNNAHKKELCTTKTLRSRFENEETSKEVLPPKKTSKEVIPPKKTSKEVIPRKTTSNEVPPPKKTSNEVQPPKNTSNEVQPPKNTSNEVQPPKNTSNEVQPKTKTRSNPKKATDATDTKPANQTHAPSEAEPDKAGAHQLPKKKKEKSKDKNLNSSSSNEGHYVLLVSQSNYEQMEGDIENIFREDPLLDSIICIEGSSNQNALKIGQVNPSLLKHKSFNKQLSFARPNKLEDQRHLDAVKIKVYCCKDDIKDDVEHIRNYSIPKSTFEMVMTEFECAVILYKV